jgi:hypothetical protein
MKKRILSILIAAIMVFAIVPFSALVASAAEKPPINSIEISVDQEIEPVTGKGFAQSDASKIVGINGLGNKAGYDFTLNTYWHYTDDPDLDLDYSTRFDNTFTTFRGGYYYALCVRIYCFGYDIKPGTKYVINTPTKTYECESTYYHGDYTDGKLVFRERTEGEVKKPFGETKIEVSGYAEGVRADDIKLTVTGDGVSLNDYTIYCATDSRTLDPDDVIEKGKSYMVHFFLNPKDGYTVTEFGAGYYFTRFVTDGNGIGVCKAEVHHIIGMETLELYYALPPITDDPMQITAPDMRLQNYELGKSIDDLKLDFASIMLTVDPEYPFEIIASKCDRDDVIDPHETYYMYVSAEIAPGYSFDGITKDMFVLNGITPDFLGFRSSSTESSLMIVYELPILHEHTAEFKNDATNHWNECTFGDKANVAPHADTNNDEKCDACGYDMPVQAPDTDPDTTPGTTPGTDGTTKPNTPNKAPDTDPDTTPGTTPGTDGTTKPNTPNKTPDNQSNGNDGLGTGAIVGIVIGSVAVVGIGGFALLWFVIKKKTFADLLAIFKKN